MDIEDSLDSPESGLIADGSFGRLVSTLIAMVRLPPFNEEMFEARSEQIALLQEGIEAFGVDANSLLRFGIADDLWQPLLILLITSPPDVIEDMNVPVDLTRWATLLPTERLEPSDVEAVPSDDSSFVSVTFTFREDISAVVRRLSRWVSSAPMDDILALTPPPYDFFERVDVQTPSSEVRDAYRWLVERHAESDLARWSFASLKLEFLRRQGDWAAPFPDRVVEPSEFDDDLLHFEMARRAAALPNTDEAPASKLMTDLKRQALGFLQEFRFREAAALFEFYIRNEPSNYEAVNNLAFCLIPIAPDHALHYLDSLDSIRESVDRGIIVYNQCLVLKLLGRGGEALDKAENYWQRQFSANPYGAFLWREDDADGGLELYNEDNVAVALATMVATIAGDLGREDRAARWRQRAAQMTARQDAAPETETS